MSRHARVMLSSRRLSRILAACLFCVFVPTQVDARSITWKGVETDLLTSSGLFSFSRMYVLYIGKTCGHRVGMGDIRSLSNVLKKSHAVDGLESYNRLLEGYSRAFGCTQEVPSLEFND